MSPLRRTTKSTRNLAAELIPAHGQSGVHADTVSQRLNHAHAFHTRRDRGRQVVIGGVTTANAGEIPRVHGARRHPDQHLTRAGRRRVGYLRHRQDLRRLAEPVVDNASHWSLQRIQNGRKDSRRGHATRGWGRCGAVSAGTLQ